MVTNQHRQESIRKRPYCEIPCSLSRLQSEKTSHLFPAFPMSENVMIGGEKQINCSPSLPLHCSLLSPFLFLPHASSVIFSTQFISSLSYPAFLVLFHLIHACAAFTIFFSPFCYSVFSFLPLQSLYSPLTYLRLSSSPALSGFSFL